MIKQLKEVFILKIVGYYMSTRRTYMTARWPTGCDGSVGLFDGFDAPEWLRYSNSVEFNCSGNDKTIKRVVWVKICGILYVN